MTSPKMIRTKIVEDAIFFPDDFLKLPKDTEIYIQRGKITLPKEGNENAKKRKPQAREKHL